MDNLQQAAVEPKRFNIKLLSITFEEISLKTTQLFKIKLPRNSEHLNNC